MKILLTWTTRIGTRSLSLRQISDLFCPSAVFGLDFKQPIPCCFVGLLSEIFLAAVTFRFYVAGEFRSDFSPVFLPHAVFGHLNGTSKIEDDPEWETVDNIVKQWLYGTLTQPVLQSILKPNATAAVVWKTIEDLFHENKETKSMELDDELRTITIGDSSVMEYCTRIKSISDLLANIGSPVPERNLVIYAINGLSLKFAHVVTTIRHQKPFPTFLEMRSMLTLEERSMLNEIRR
ncbi:unnamed protein product [Lactuca virosa]|uniref:Retrotransposon gag domain-containing protein n=1 Tax=Lactuca virosa TaxID=75947 RepID=A0AAU9MKB6_9ASTR|nr:unnamed protein product [Lactuca virosa]